jgi:hypothetical protein
MNVDPIFLIIGFICFLLAAFGVPIPRVNLIALGLAFWIATAIF